MTRFIKLFASGNTMSNKGFQIWNLTFCIILSALRYNTIIHSYIIQALLKQSNRFVMLRELFQKSYFDHFFICQFCVVAAVAVLKAVIVANEFKITWNIQIRIKNVEFKNQDNKCLFQTWLNYYIKQWFGNWNLC